MHSRIAFTGILWLVSATLAPTLRAQAATGNPNATARMSAANSIIAEIDEDAAEPQSSSTPPSSPPHATSKSSERIFGVVPAYNITDAQNAPPLTSGEKFRLFAKGTLDPFPFMAYALQAGISQASDSHNGYGQGLAGYGKRFGAACLDGTSARFFGTYAFPSLLRQDPRYFRKGQGRVWSRVRYSITRGFVTRSDSGNSQPNWSNVLGKFTAAGLSNLYYPAADRGADLTLTRVGISVSYQTLGNLAIEFWPEIHRKLSSSKRSN
jgi:hypothetical protein